MERQTFPVGPEAHIFVSRLNGDLQVRPWDQPVIRVSTDAYMDEMQQEGNSLILTGCASDLELRVPADAIVSATDISGDVEIGGIRQVELTNVSGDVELRQISASASATRIAGDVEATHIPLLRVYGSVSGDIELAHIQQVEVETTSGDLEMEQVAEAILGDIQGDLEVEGLETSLRCNSVNGECTIEGSSEATVVIGNVQADLEIHSAGLVQSERVGGDCDVRAILGTVEIGYVGGDASLTDIHGNAKIGTIGADASLKDLRQHIEVGNIGGDLLLRTSFLAGSQTRLHVAGDARVILPDAPDLTLRATVQGAIRGLPLPPARSSNVMNYTYGSGAARLELHVGQDLDMRGGSQSGERSKPEGAWDDLEREFADFGREMAAMGREMGRRAQEFGRDIAEAFGPRLGSEAARRAEEQARRMAERVRRSQQRAEERGRRHHGSRRHRQPGPEHWLDPEQIEHLHQQAHRAAAEGIRGAMEAFEQAMRAMGITIPPVPPSPVPPSHPEVSVPPQTSEPTTGPTMLLRDKPASQQPPREIGESPPAPNRDQQREAILRMVAEGRITPAEGNLLLSALEE